MLRSIARFPRLLPLGVLAGAGLLASVLLSTAGAGHSQAQQAGFNQCPAAGAWAVAVWQGRDNASVEEAIATCPAVPIAAVFSFNVQNQVWLYWFAGAPPGLSTLTTLKTSQMAFLFGRAAATPTPSPTPTPAPGGALPEVLAAYDDLIKYIGSIPDDVLNRGQRESLIRYFEDSQDTYRRGQLCEAADALALYLQEAQMLRRGNLTAVAEDLYNRGQMLRHDLLAPYGRPTLVGGRPCPGYDAETTVVVGESDNRHLVAAVNFADMRFITVEAGGEVFTQVLLPGMQPHDGRPGLPGVPMWHTLVGVPRGARPMITARILGSQEYLVNLYPYQTSPEDQQPPEEEMPPPSTFDDKPFAKDARSYNINALFPPDPCIVIPLGDARDLPVAQVQCAAGQYNPVTDQLMLFTGLEFEVTFQGGSGYFLTQHALNPFESTSAYTSGVLNSGVTLRYIDPAVLHWTCIGEEFMILTHPDFRSAADTLRDWKRDKGISTNVYEVGTGTTNDTAAEIDAFIEQHWNDCLVRPSYVLLLGDAEYIPPSGYWIDSDGTTSIGSDYYYALTSSGYVDVTADVGLARIPVDTQTQAQTVVDKIISYESSPPSMNSFYDNVSIASQFQCCREEADGSALNGQAGTDKRAFIETSEFVRDQLLSEGYTVERIYMETVSSTYTGSTTPARYYDGTLLPSALGSSSGYAWSGSTANITNAFNAGRFLLLHRDHGSRSGFANPSFSTTNASSLTNGSLLPVVFSVNCASGWFDNETDSNSATGSTSVYFMEQLLRSANGGMVGGLGDTRNSPTWANNALTRGFFDAIWPDTVSGYGSSTSIERLGDILNHGKEYMLSQISVSWSGTPALDAGDVVDELFLWHAYGDPTQEIWTSRPFVLTLQFSVVAQFGALLVNYAEEGATITALQEDERGDLRPIGRAPVRNGQASLQYVVAPDPARPILLSACKPNAVCRLLGSTGGQTPRPTPTPTLRPTPTPTLRPTPTPTLRPTPTPTRPPGFQP